MSWGGGGLTEYMANLKLSSCFCTSSGTPLTASALVRPSSVALIHASSELSERNSYCIVVVGL